MFFCCSNYYRRLVTGMLGTIRPNNQIGWGIPEKRPEFFPPWLPWHEPSASPDDMDGKDWCNLLKRAIGKQFQGQIRGSFCILDGLPSFSMFHLSVHWSVSPCVYCSFGLELVFTVSEDVRVQRKHFSLCARIQRRSEYRGSRLVIPTQGMSI